ncbi:MAG: hypothetical protein LW650_09015 [Planctomycetaceae bacterium]|jgi:hypothetical protein|nr:hypothetical protein [Planctomycetaceae bacterium]
MAADVLLINLALWPALALAGGLSLEPASAWVRAATLQADTSLLLDDPASQTRTSDPSPATDDPTATPSDQRTDFVKVDWSGATQADATVPLATPRGDAASPIGASLLRTGGTLALSDAFAVEAGMSTMAVNRRWAGGQAVVRGDAAGVGREAALYDVTLKLTALDAGPLRLSMLGGVRASSIDAAARSRTETAAFAAIPVTGLALDLSLTPKTVLRTSAVGSAEGARPGSNYTEFRIESVTNLSPSAAVSVGWQRMSTDLERGALQAAMRRDAVVLELRFRF